jgi:hypothetical protein
MKTGKQFSTTTVYEKNNKYCFIDLLMQINVCAGGHSIIIWG